MKQAQRSGSGYRVSIVVTGALVFILCVGFWLWRTDRIRVIDDGSGTLRVPVTFSGGHETHPVDHGRPVILIAAALGVPAEVFREAFSRVQPAPGGTVPGQHRVQQNKEKLMAVLGPHGISNERLDTVSNYYRYNPQWGRLWPTDDAKAYALVRDGRITGFEIVAGGSGYSTSPAIQVPGFDGSSGDVQLSFGQQFDRNGSVSGIRLQ